MEVHSSYGSILLKIFFFGTKKLKSGRAIFVPTETNFENTTKPHLQNHQIIKVGSLCSICSTYKIRLKVPYFQKLVKAFFAYLKYAAYVLHIDGGL